MEKGEEVLAVAAREIGYHQGRDGSNKFGAWFGADRVPWCMEFVQWCYAQAGIPLPLRTASCGELLRWYQAHRPECVTDKPVPGCVVIFDFPGTKYRTDHTGLFVKLDGQKITTIDGNTSGGNDSNGGYVQQRTRPLGYANPVYIVPWGLEEEMDIDAFVRELTPEQAYKIQAKAELYAAQRPLPVSWDARRELEEAVALGITDGGRPMAPATRLEAALMAKRAAKTQDDQLK